jgi:hypothetical protein
MISGPQQPVNMKNSVRSMLVLGEDDSVATWKLKPQDPFEQEEVERDLVAGGAECNAFGLRREQTLGEDVDQYSSCRRHHS